MTERNIVTQPPTAAEIQAMARLAPGGATDLLSRRSARYRELGLEGVDLSEAEWCALLSRESRLLKRPLLTDGSRLVIGYDAATYRSLAS